MLLTLRSILMLDSTSYRPRNAILPSGEFHPEAPRVDARVDPFHNPWETVATANRYLNCG